MKKGCLLVVFALLSGCVPKTIPTMAVSLVATEQPVSPAVSPTIQPFTPTFSPTDTTLPTETATASATATAAATATQTPIPYMYVFPIQPIWAASYAEGTASHGYPAIDLFSVTGTEYVAVTDGVVDFVSYEDTWDPAADNPAVRGGLSVAFIGDDGVRYYGSHLSNIASGIAAGVRVKAGQPLGLVGNSGDARNTLSHVHFGISRPTYPEDWKARRGQVDPFPYLQAWKDGQAVTPTLPAP